MNYKVKILHCPLPHAQQFIGRIGTVVSTRHHYLKVKFDDNREFYFTESEVENVLA